MLVIFLWYLHIAIQQKILIDKQNEINIYTHITNYKMDENKYALAQRFFLIVSRHDMVYRQHGTKNVMVLKKES